ncbi:MAG: EpsG family protein [Eubacterium sp.]|nr:EpsG family protein [Eubacterium sp.]
MRTYGLVGIVFWMGLMGIAGTDYRLFHSEFICDREEYRYNRLFAFFVFLPVIIWAGFRSGVGYVDTNAYIALYSYIPTSFADLTSYLDAHPSDPGFTILLYIIKTIFGSSYTPFLFIVALIEGIAVIVLYRKFSPHYLISIFLFIASAEYFSWMFNGMRQFLSVSIVMFAFPLLLEKKYVKYIIVVALAATVHMTAVMMIPVAFIVSGKPWNRRTMALIAVGVFALMMTSRFTSILDVATQNTQYSGAVMSWNEMGDDGTNPIRVLVCAVPTIIAFFGRRILEAEENPVIDVCINMSIFSTVLWLISMVTSGIYMGRLPIFASVYNYILLPYEIDILFTRKNRGTMFALMIVLYLLYYYYQLHNIWGVL